MRRTWFGFLLLVLLVLEAACGSTRTVSTNGAQRALPPTSAPEASGPWKSVTFSGVTFQVPNGWPVYDLRTDPTRCVRFDVHAVYLGSQGPDPACPARALGKTDAIQVEAQNPQTASRVLPSTDTQIINGEPALIEPHGEASHNLVASFPDLGLVLTITYGSTASMAQRVLQTVHPVGPSATTGR